MNPKNISILDFTYQLPNDKIAFYPLQQRDQSKLLVYNNGIITEDIYQNVSQHLPSGSLIVFNNTKVVEARILFKKESGASIEIFCLEPHSDYADITSAMLTKKSVLWMCLIGGASKWKHGQVLEKKIVQGSKSITVFAKYINKINEQFTVELSWSDESLTFAEVLHAAGSIPLPPYIKREALQEDAERYQTVYAVHEGSVAAPTAGLHFTNNVLNTIAEKNIQSCFVTLHVGAGTFKPVKASTMQDHEMHSEFIDLSISTIETIRNFASKDITAVGTTSLRTLESLYWLGVKLLTNKSGSAEPLKIEQWDAYELNSTSISLENALDALLKKMQEEQKDRLITTTRLLIMPGYTFRVVNRLITNFHQPHSTLLLLVAAFIGEDWKKVYDYALKKEFRFLSYGDGCLLQRH